MVPRAGYTVNNGVIDKYIVNIAWDKGFTQQAKLSYINELGSKISHIVSPVLEVTSAAPTYEGKQFSPLILTVPGTSTTVEQFVEDNGFITYPQLIEYVYLRSLSPDDIAVLMQYKAFTDVFHNPSKSIGNTQALTCAIMQLLVHQNKLCVLSDPEFYLDWRYSSVIINVIE